MLIKRIITASILAPLLILLIYLPSGYFLIFLGLIGVVAGFEWVNLAQFTTISQRLFFGFLWLVFGFWGFAIIASFADVMLLVALSLIFWLSNLVILFNYPRWQKYWFNNPYIRAANGVLLLAPTLLLLAFLQHFNPNALLFLLLLIWSADIGAYFIGKYFGSKLLAPKISPKKTIEGVIGGVLAGVILTGFLSSFLFQQFEVKHLLLAALIVLMSIVGDLIESIFKRAANIKDSGNILPGHGGILDRIDSLTAALPLFVLLLFLLG